MRLYITALLTTALAALLAFPAYAAQDDVKVTGRVDIKLGDFDIVIGDSGERYDGWDASATRVQVSVLDGRRTRDYYFDSLPAALFVLREMYGAPRILSIGVPEFAGVRHLSHGHSGHGLLDGAQAYYLLDYDHESRGGLPLVLAFSNYGDALDELYYRNGEVLGFEDLVWSLYRWADRDRDRIYWRGLDKDRWDNSRWNRAYCDRWDGWGWDTDRGWLWIDVNLGDEDRDRNWRDPQHYDRNNGHSNRNHGERGERARGRERQRGGDRDGNGRGDRQRERNDDDGGRERDHGNGRENR